MKNRKLFVIAATVGGLLGGHAQLAEAAKASSKDAQIQALERRLQLLEKRLEASESGAGKVATGKPGAEAPTIKSIDQKVKLIERKLEVDKEVADAAKSSAPTFEAGASGFKWTSADKQHSLRLRGYVQADGDFFLDDSDRAVAGTNTGTGGAATPLPPNGLATDRFTIRRARLQVSGTLWKYADFLVTPEFAGTTPSLYDAWVDLHYFPFASLTAGKQKGPVSLERLVSGTSLLFVERAYPTQLAPNRDTGFLLHGEFAAPGRTTQYGGPINFSDFFSYQVGVFNGALDNQNPANSATANFDSKDFEGRIFAHPFQLTNIAALQGFGLGLAGTYGEPKRGALASLVSPGQNSIVTYSTGVTADGSHYRIYPQAYWYYGPYGVFGEYSISSQTLTSGNLSRSITQDNEAWQVAASYVITGEDNTFQGVKPRQAFDPLKGNWGAVQFAARWSELKIDGDTFTNYGTAAAPNYLFANPRGSVEHATSWALGLNWFLNSNVKLTADYEQTEFKGGAAGGLLANSSIVDRPTERVFFTRVQLSY
jgi:phosphate-selective porin OprO/OprP